MRKKVLGAKVSPELERQVERFRKSKGLTKKSDAVRELIRRGLTQSG